MGYFQQYQYDKLVFPIDSLNLSKMNLNTDHLIMQYPNDFFYVNIFHQSVHSNSDKFGENYFLV